MKRKLLLVFATFVTMAEQRKRFHPFGLEFETPRRMVGDIVGEPAHDRT